MGAGAFVAGAPSTATAPAGAVGIAVRSGCAIEFETSRSVDRLVPRSAASCVPAAGVAAGEDGGTSWTRGHDRRAWSERRRPSRSEA